MEYELDTIYEARVPVGNSFHRVYFLFSNSKLGGKCVSIGEGIHTGPEWSVYHIATATDVYHTCNEGTWMMHIPEECNPTWSFRQWGVSHSHKATISLANEEPEFKGKHYDALIIDDIPMGSKSSSPEKVKKTNEWYEKMIKEDKAKGSILMGNPILGSKEVKKKMYLQLINVIIFNRKTKEVDFREDVIAENDDEAYLLAVQQFGKYDPKVHVKAAKCILGFDELEEN